MLTAIPLNELQNSIIADYDLFICFNSFETRSATLSLNCDISRFKQFYIFTSETLREEAKSNLEILKSIIPTEKRDIISIPIDNPVGSADKIKSALYRIRDKSTPKVFIDITTFTHETLLILLAIVKEKIPGAQVTCAYINAADYSCDTEKQEQKWLSRGIGDIRSILGYSGIIKPSQKTLLMVIVGYEYERAVNIIDSIEPDFLALGYGIASNATTEKNHGANMHYAQLVKQMATYYDDVEDFTLPCNNPYEAATAIKEQIQKIGQGKNVIIVPMNNKLTTIGAAMVNFEQPDIQLCYAPAIVYNYSAYSTPGETCYLFDLDFSAYT